MNTPCPFSPNKRRFNPSITTTRSNAMKRILIGLLAALTMTMTATTPADAAKKAPAPPPPVLNSGTVLFVDSHRVETMSGVARQYNQGYKVPVANHPAGQVDVEPVTTYRGANDASDGDTDLDSKAMLTVNTVLRTGNLYRMYLRSGKNTGYRESRDGVHWSIHDPDSVILVKDLTDVSVTRDPVNGYYYMHGWSKPKAYSSHRGYVEMVSKDGIHFGKTTSFLGYLSLLFGDEIRVNTNGANGLIAIAKQTSPTGPACSAGHNRGGRTFGVNYSASSRSARVWHVPTRTITSDCVDANSVPATPGMAAPMQVYGVPFLKYGDQYLAFPWLFHITTRPPSDPGKTGFVDGPVDTQIASSPDITKVALQRSAANVKIGGRWTRPNLIRRGGAGSWDAGMAYGQSLVTIGNRSYLYYTGWNKGHLPQNGRIARPGVVSWRLDSFVGLSVRRGVARGSVRTKAFRLAPAAARRNLFVNAKARGLSVAVLDGRTNKVIPGWRASQSTVVRGDQTNARVTWAGKNLGRLKSRSIKLVFSYTSGSTLYSYRVS